MSGMRPHKCDIVYGLNSDVNSELHDLGDIIVAQAVKDYFTALENICYQYELGQLGNLSDRYYLYETLGFFFNDDGDGVFMLLCPSVRPEIFIDRLNARFSKNYKTKYGTAPDIESAMEFNPRLSEKMENFFNRKLYVDKADKPYAKKLDDDSVRDIRAMHKQGIKVKEIAEKYGVRRNRIDAIISNRVYKGVK